MWFGCTRVLRRGRTISRARRLSQGLVATAARVPSAPSGRCPRLDLPPAAAYEGRGMQRSWLAVRFVVLLVAGTSSLALAHAILTKASLEGGVRADAATTVTLHFNAGIETNFTRVVLVDAKGATRTLEVTPGASPDRVTVGLPPLPAGSYGLRDKVPATDGHVTERLLRFTVTADP